MAYISALWNGTQQTNAFMRDEAFIATIWIGYDSVLPLVYSLMVEMYPTDQGTEFAFPIIRTNQLTGISDPIFDSSEANAIIPKSYRSKIREVLLATAERVVRGSNRQNFFMTTFCDHLPERALAKYDFLCDVFMRCGYDVTRTEPEPGSYFWQMIRRN